MQYSQTFLHNLPAENIILALRDFVVALSEWCTSNRLLVFDKVDFAFSLVAEHPQMILFSSKTVATDGGYRKRICSEFVT